MKRRFQVNITQREEHSWNPFAEEIVETRNRVGVEVRYPGQGLIGRLTRLGSDQPEKREKERPERGPLAFDARKAEVKLAGTVEKAQAKLIKASGNRFEVKDRDGHPRGYFPSLPPAQARADECGGMVYDRLEGRMVYTARDEEYDVPDQGVDAEPTAEEMDW